MRNRIIISAIFIIIAAAISLFVWQKQKNPKPEAIALADIDRRLSESNRKIYEDRIKQAENYLSSLDPGTEDYYTLQANTFVYLAQQYYGLGQMQKSKEWYERALGLDPKSLSALSGLSATLTDAGDLEGALSVLKTALDDDARNPDIWAHYIELMKDIGAGEKELDRLYQDALQGTNRHTDLLTKYANFQESQGKIKEAIALWEEAIKAYPQRTELFRAEIKRLKSKE